MRKLPDGGKGKRMALPGIGKLYVKIDVTSYSQIQCL